MTYESEVLADSPLLYWRLGESSGTVAEDASPNNRDGTYAGSPTLGAGSLIPTDLANTAVSCDGTNDKVTYSSAGYLTSATAYTIEFWIDTTDMNSDQWLADLYAAAPGHHYVQITSGVISAHNSAVSVSGPNIADGDPHHIAVTWTTTTDQFIIYVDGVSVATSAAAAITNPTFDQLAVAGHYFINGNCTAGIFDEFALYSTALSADRIIDHFNAAEPTPPEITTTVLPDGQSTVPYETELEVTGEAGTWSITDGSLPVGLALDPDTGIISGAPFGAGEFCFDVTYTETESELSDTVPLCITVTAAPPPPTPSGDLLGCDGCQDTWRLELLDLATGTRVGWLKYVSFEIDDLLNQVGPGQIICNVRDVRTPDVWPHLRAIAFNRVSGPGATSSAPVIEAVAMIETLSAESGGTLTLGVQSIEWYYNYRIIGSITEYENVDQNEIAADLINDRLANGIQLSAEYETSAITRTRTYYGTDDKPVLEAINELTETEDGPDYIRVHSKTGGVVSTVLRFVDYAGDTTPAPLNAKRGLVAYGLEVDGTQHANWVRGRGDDVLNTHTADRVSTSIYPRFDKGVQWSDVTDEDTVDQNTEGYANANGDPIAIPDVTVADPNLWVPRRLGDTVNLNIDHGALRFFGPARIIGRSLSSSAEAPALCTFSFVPLVSAQESILSAPPSTGSGCC